MFADLVPNPDQALLRANLTLQIFRAFSTERLMQFLAALGHDVEIRVKPTRKEHGPVSVVAA